MITLEDIDNRVQYSLLDLCNPTDQQLLFLKTIRNHQYTLYGGAAGGGKSYILRWALLMYLYELARTSEPDEPDRVPVHGARVGLFCEDYPSLQDRHISKIKLEWPSQFGTWHETSHEFRLHAGAGTICFRNLDNPQKYLSSEWAALGVDELTQNPIEVFDFLRMRLRWPGVAKPVFMAGTNPGGQGHSWVKQLWIDRDFPKELKPVAHEFALVQAKASDNPYLPPGYYDQLNTLPDALRRAYAEGDWNIFPGQVFTDFKRDIHVVEPFAIPSWWTRWVGNDPGYADPSCWHWCAADQDGNVYIYDEQTYQRTSPSDQARDLARRHPEPVDFIVTGMDAFINHPETGKCAVDYYQEGGLYGFQRPIHGPGSKAARVHIMHEYLGLTQDKDGKVSSRLKIFSTCKRLIETLPVLVGDDNKREQVQECAIDHWHDSATYAISAWHAKHSSAPAHKFAVNQLGHILGHDKPIVVARDEWETRYDTEDESDE